MEKLETFQRDDIFIGDVVKIRNLLLKTEKIHIGALWTERKIEFAPYFYTEEYKFLRKILFVPTEIYNEKNLAYDLLYDSPVYYTLDYKFYENEYKEGRFPSLPDNPILIANAHNMGHYLKAVGYKEQLGLKDAKKIRKDIFGTRHINYFSHFLYALTNEEIEKYWEVILNAKDRSINEFLLDRLGDMAKIYNLDYLVGYQHANFIDLNRIAKETYLENKYNRFQPDAIEEKNEYNRLSPNFIRAEDNQRILIRK